MSKYAFLALSVNPGKLRWKLIRSLYEHYSPEEIKSHNFFVACQGFSEEDKKMVQEKGPDLNYVFMERFTGSISKIRKQVYNQVPYLFDKSQYDYLILIDDDFVIGEKALSQYDAHIDALEDLPFIGFVPCHRRIKRDMRLQTSPLEYPYPYDLSAVSMRCGLILRNGIITPDELLHDDIVYHEEFWCALQVYLKGYELARAWVDVFHKSMGGGLGNELQKKWGIFTCNDAPSSKKIAHQEGLFDIDDSIPFYATEGADRGRVSQLAHQIHSQNKKLLGF